MTRARAFFSGLVFAVLIGGSAGTARAAEIKDFVGDYEGSAITVQRQLYGLESVRNRDMDVSIKTDAGGGFSITWTTTFLSRQADGEKTVRTTSVTFVPTGKPGVWRATVSGNPLVGRPLIWASLEDKSLTVNVVEVSESGNLATATYVRSLTKDGLKLEFQATQNGNRVRRIVGWLKRKDTKK